MGHDRIGRCLGRCALSTSWSRILWQKTTEVSKINKYSVVSHFGDNNLRNCASCASNQYTGWVQIVTPLKLSTHFSGSDHILYSECLLLADSLNFSHFGKSFTLLAIDFCSKAVQIHCSVSFNSGIVSDIAWFSWLLHAAKTWVNLLTWPWRNLCKDANLHF